MSINTKSYQLSRFRTESGVELRGQDEEDLLSTEDEFILLLPTP